MFDFSAACCHYVIIALNRWVDSGLREDIIKQRKLTPYFVSRIPKSWIVASIIIIVFSFLAVFALSKLTASAANTNPSVSIEQCDNGGVGATPVSCDNPGNPNNHWGSGNVNGTKAHWQEGDFLPYRAILKNLNSGVNTVTFSFDTAKSSELKHAIDYLGSFDTTETTGAPTANHANQIDPCGDVFACTPSTPTATALISVPADFTTSYPTACANGTWTGVVAPGAIKAWSAAAGGISAMSINYPDSPIVPNGIGDCTVKFKITFTVAVGTTDVVIAWGGHVASSSNWGAGNAVPTGSPYHMHAGFPQESPVGTFFNVGNQDLALASSAIPPTLTVNKVCVPDTDSGLFNLRVDGTNAGTGANAPCGGTTGAVALSTGNHTVSETAGTDTNLANYSSAISGDCASNGTINLASGDNKTCTITNTLIKANLTLVKHVTNDNGGTAANTDWTLAASGPTPISGASGSGTVTNAAVNPGSYSLSESGGPSAYTASLYSCVKNGGAPVSGNSISLASNDTATCTITNDDNAPSLTLVKVVTNDNGGTATPADWNLTASGPTGFSGPGPSVVNGASFDTGTYTLSESTGPDGYSASSWVCVGGSQNDDQIILSLGQSATCTITNNDQPAHIIVIKHVIKDNGGTAVASDFTMHISGTAGSADFAGAESPGINTQVNAGTFSVSEDGVAGYAASHSGDCSGTIAVGQTKTCTITNNDIQPKLTLIKHVINDNGGTAIVSDFPLFVSGTGVTSGVAHGFDAGSYTASETQLAGYSASTWSGDCAANGAITLSLGDDKTCEITNDDIQPLLTVTKVVINDNGGTAVVSDFPLFVGSTGVTSGAQNGFNAGSYVVSETGKTGYTQTGITGDCDANGNVSLAVGDVKTCTITNDDNAPTLTLVKEVVNDNGGTAVSSDWTLTATGPTGFSGPGPSVGNGASFDAGTYDLSEAGPVGYAASAWVCGGGSQSDSDTIVLGLGQDATCTITNDDISPQLIVIKHAINDNGGQAVAGDFTINVTGTNVSDDSFPGEESPGKTVTLNAGSYSVDEDSFSGYDKTLSTDCTGTIALGATKTCTVTNDDQAAHLIVIKHVINDNGGNNVAGDFTMQVSGTNVSSSNFPGVESPGTTITLDAGTYGVDEAAFTGYSKTLGADCSGSIANGATKTCTITNDDIAPSITLIKSVINNNGGSAGANDFGITVGGSPATSGDSNAVDANTPIALNEAGLAGYSFVSLTGDGKCPSVLGGTVTLDEGEHVTCTITNDDQPAHLIVIKHVINDNGGSASASDFTIFIDGVSVEGDSSFAGAESPGVDKTLTSVGNYAIGEIPGVPGYAGSFSTDCAGTIALGQTKTCTVTNDDVAAQLTVIKHVINDNGGTRVASNFTINVTGTNVSNPSFPGAESPGTTVTLNAGSYSVDEADSLGYAKTLQTSCSGTIALGESRTCTITNNDPVVITRTLGFWQTHITFATAIFNNGNPSAFWTICTGGRDISNIGELMGGFWADIAKTTTKAKRSSLDQARMQLMQQLLAAMLNVQAFGANDGGLIALAKAAYCGTNRSLILTYVSQLDVFNSSGDNNSTTLDIGKADPKTAKNTAVNTLWDNLP